MDVSINRKYLPEEFKLESWEKLEPFFTELLNREAKSREDLVRWLRDINELEAALQEELGRTYIQMTCFTDKQEFRDKFNFIITEIEPKIAPLSNELNKKLIEHPEIENIDIPGFDILLRGVKKELELFREENIPLQAQIQGLQSKYGEINGPLSIKHNNEELTLPQAANLLFSKDRNEREEVFYKIQNSRIAVEKDLDELFDQMIPLRQSIAENAGFKNYRDYIFKAKGRFDYSPEDCKEFHEAVLTEVVPLLDDIAKDRKEKLSLDSLKPWDMKVDKKGLNPLKPFSSSDDLVEKSISLFNKLDPYFGECLQMMKKIGHLDLESRKNKAPGGYNYPLDEIGVPFIFMNATSTFRDMITLMHEGGHAVHSFLTRDYEFLPFKHPSSEVAELASMSMELLTMDYWDEFFDSEEELWRAKEEHLEQIIETLPWVAVIDKFQHWIYENPNHTREERQKQWTEIFDAFRSDIIDYSGLEHIKKIAWHKQLHIFEVPFYYIEYAIAQLGAIGVWINYRENAEKGLADYKKGLELGYTRTIPKIYEQAGVKFDFSKEHIRQLIQFVKSELDICRQHLA